MSICLVIPADPALPVRVENLGKLSALQAEVGGYIEGFVVGRFMCYWNEDGIRLGFPMNERFTAFFETFDPFQRRIVGPVVVTGAPGPVTGENTDLRRAEIVQIRKLCGIETRGRPRYIPSPAVLAALASPSMTLTQVARDFGVSIGTVRRLAMEGGFPNRRRGRIVGSGISPTNVSRREKKIKALFESGLDLEKIAARVDLTRERVRQICLLLGLPARRQKKTIRRKSK